MARKLFQFFQRPNPREAVEMQRLPAHIPNPNLDINQQLTNIRAARERLLTKTDNLINLRVRFKKRIQHLKKKSPSPKISFWDRWTEARNDKLELRNLEKNIARITRVLMHANPQIRVTRYDEQINQLENQLVVRDAGFAA